MENEEKQEVAEEAVKKRKRGGSRDGNGSPIIPTGNINMTDDENAAMCAYALDVFHAKPVDLRSPEEVSDAIDGYFKNCMRRGLRPGNLGLYASLGLSKQEVSNELRGVTHKLSPDVIDLLKKAKVAMSTYREMLGSTGKINPVTLIFWQKNYDGLEDKQTVEVAPRTDLEPDRTPDEIQKQLERDIPIDVDAEEIG